MQYTCPRCTAVYDDPPEQHLCCPKCRNDGEGISVLLVLSEEYERTIASGYLKSDDSQLPDRPPTEDELKAGAEALANAVPLTGRARSKYLRAK